MGQVVHLIGSEARRRKREAARQPQDAGNLRAYEGIALDLLGIWGEGRAADATRDAVERVSSALGELLARFVRSHGMMFWDGREGLDGTVDRILLCDASFMVSCLLLKCVSDQARANLRTPEEEEWPHPPDIDALMAVRSFIHSISEAIPPDERQGWKPSLPVGFPSPSSAHG